MSPPARMLVFFFVFSVAQVVLMGSKSKTLQLVKLQFQEHKATRCTDARDLLGDFWGLTLLFLEPSQVKRVFHALVLGHPSYWA